MIEIIQSNSVEILSTILTAVFSYIGLKLKANIEKCLNDKTKKDIIEDTVKYVEQLYSNLNGDEKLTKAKEKAVEWLNERKINISNTELEVLIESVLNEIKEKKKGE